MKCPHGLEIEEDETKYTEPGTYCRGCVADALRSGALGIDVGLFTDSYVRRVKNKAKAERRKDNEK